MLFLDSLTSLLSLEENKIVTFYPTMVIDLHQITFSVIPTIPIFSEPFYLILCHIYALQFVSFKYQCNN